MIDKLQAIEDRYVELSQKISDPEIISNVNEWRKYVKEHAAIEDIVLKYREYKKVIEDINSTKELLSSDDLELREMAEEELLKLEEKKRGIIKGNKSSSYT